MQLQIALDTFNTQEAVNLINSINSVIDIAEIGTPMLLNYGNIPVKTISEKFKGLTVLADSKIMDAGEIESANLFAAGARIVTVMGVTHDETVKGAVKAAKKYGRKIMADMMCVDNIERRACKLVSLGVDYICVHSAVDVQKFENPFISLERLVNTIDRKHCAVAGGVNLQNIGEVIKYKPEIVIVGNGITGANNKILAAEAIRKEIMKV